MTRVEQDLYQFSTYIPPIDLSFHQYLLATDEPILFHTGNAQQAASLIPQLKAALNGKTLKYVFVSHFEADECGGLSLILGNFPGAMTICSEVTARQLSGFGYRNEVIIKNPGEKLNSNWYQLEFIGYPSEMHLWEGLLVIENQRGIFFSSDLMIRHGEANGTILNSDWNTEIDNIRQDQVPDPERLGKLRKNLAQLSPGFVATGHGPCLRLK
jgi:flavorubredoxin